jgi:PAS domain S-box-containing protein
MQCLTGLRFDDAFPLYLIDFEDEGATPVRIRFSIQDVLQGAVLDGTEAAFIRKDGTSFSLLIGAKPLMPFGGQRNGAVVTMMDLTPRKRAELHLEVRNQQLRYHSELTKTITDNTSEALFLTNLDGRINFMNPAAERKFGWSAEALIGKNLYEKLHPHHAQANAMPRQRILPCGNQGGFLRARRWRNPSGALLQVSRAELRQGNRRRFRGMGHIGMEIFAGGPPAQRREAAAIPEDGSHRTPGRRHRP